MERFAAFWMSLQVWPSRRGILFGIAALLATVVLMPVRPLVELWIDTIVAMVIGFLVAHAVDYNDPTNTKAPDLLE
jgi:sugar phosphate permease